MKTSPEHPVSLEEVSFAYNPGSPDPFLALCRVSLVIAKGEFITIVGPNGSGKSTLARILNGLLSPTSGQARVVGLSTAVPENLLQIRASVGMVFQNPDNQIVGHTVEEDVAFGPENLNLSSSEIRERVEMALEVVGLERYRHFNPRMLSGGQKQLLAMAGVLAMRPQCMILDEPTSMLDARHRGKILALIDDLNQNLGTTIVLITHNLQEALRGRRSLIISSGRLVYNGDLRPLLEVPEKLARLGIEVPPVVRVARVLRNRGYVLPHGIVTPRELVDSLCPSA